MNCASLLGARYLEGPNVRDGHCPLKAHTLVATLPWGTQEFWRRCLEVPGISRAGRGSSVICPGAWGAVGSAGKSSGEGTCILGVGWHL